MSSLILSSGTYKQNSLSNLPALRNPESRFSGLEHAAMTNILLPNKLLKFFKYISYFIFFNLLNESKDYYN